MSLSVPAAVGRTVCLCVLNSLLWAQPPAATIAGNVSGPQGALAGASVRARNTRSGAAFEAATNSTGSYALALQPGTYDLFVNLVAYVGFIRRDVVLHAGESLPLNVVLRDT